jgi:hypothetical protein
MSHCKSARSGGSCVSRQFLGSTRGIGKNFHAKTDLKLRKFDSDLIIFLWVIYKVKVILTVFFEAGFRVNILSGEETGSFLTQSTKYLHFKRRWAPSSKLFH